MPHIAEPRAHDTRIDPSGLDVRDTGSPRLDGRDGGVHDVVTVPVIEERLEIGREVVDTGHTLRLRKEVESVPHLVQEPVFTDRVEVRRVAVGRVVDQVPAVRHEGDLMVVPVVHERLVVHREMVLVEEIHLARHRETTQASAEVVTRHEKVHVERHDPATGQWHPEDGVR